MFQKSYQIFLQNSGFWMLGFIIALGGERITWGRFALSIEFRVPPSIERELAMWLASANANLTWLLVTIVIVGLVLLYILGLVARIKLIQKVASILQPKKKLKRQRSQKPVNNSSAVNIWNVDIRLIGRVIMLKLLLLGLPAILLTLLIIWRSNVSNLSALNMEKLMVFQRFLTSSEPAGIKVLIATLALSIPILGCLDAFSFRAVSINQQTVRASLLSAWDFLKVNYLAIAGLCFGFFLLGTVVGTIAGGLGFGEFEIMMGDVTKQLIGFDASKSILVVPYWTTRILIVVGLLLYGLYLAWQSIAFTLLYMKDSVA